MTDIVSGWNHTNPFVPGDTIRSAPMNEKLDGIAQKTQEMAQLISRNAIVFQNPAGSTVIPSTTVNSFILVQPDGAVGLFPKATFDSAIAAAVDAGQSAATSAAAALLSEQRAKASEIAAAESAEIAQGAAVSVAGAAFFAGDWNAATGNFPAAPADGSSIWRASADGTGASAAVKTGDFVIWDLINSQYRYFVGVSRVAALETSTQNSVSSLTTQVARARTFGLVGALR